jgi:DNA-binding LacI/PurR family transcriptional regulator
MAQIRWTEIADALRASIAEQSLRPGDRIPSEKVVAAQWGVCRMTAHRALSELEREGLVIRKRRVGTVVRAQNGAAELDNEPLAPSEPLPAGAVALLAFHMNDFPQVEYVHGFRAGLPGENHLLLCDTGNTAPGEADHLRRLEAQNAGAVALYPTCDPENTALIAGLARRGVPVVCLDRIPDGLAGKDGAAPLCDAFVTDNYGATLAALRTLTARGHSRIALLGPHTPEVGPVREREDGWREALREAGVDGDDAARLSRRFPRGAGHQFDVLAQAAYDALYTMRHERGAAGAPTAVFCLDDFFLSAALEACDRLGLSVPGEFEIVGFSDFPPLAGRLARGVHRITQRAHDMGRRAAERLRARQSGAETGPAHVVRLPARLLPAGGGVPVELNVNPGGSEA